MAIFREVEHGFKVLSLSVPKILAKNAILAAHWAQFGHFGIYTRQGPQNTATELEWLHLWGQSLVSGFYSFSSKYKGMGPGLGVVLLVMYF